MEISPGDTFLYKSPSDKMHLHIVVEKVISDDIVLCAFVSSVKPGKGYDRSCELNPGDSPFINKPSYVVYDKMRLYHASFIQRMIEQSEAIYKGKLSASILKRVIDGALSSKMTAQTMKKYLIDSQTND